jgi:hypothetical protein
MKLQPLCFPGVKGVNLADNEYQLYHRTILRRRARNSLSIEESNTLTANAQACSVEPSQIIISCLLAHQKGGIDRPFYPRMLLGDNAMRYLEMYREECVTRYGQFDLSLLSDTASLPRQHNIHKRLWDSEELACAWAVSVFQVDKKGSDKERLYSLYLQRESSLDPWWLATEPTYHGLFERLSEEDEEDLSNASSESSYKTMLQNLRAIKTHRDRVKRASVSPLIQVVLQIRNSLTMEIAHRQAMKIGLSLRDTKVCPVYTEPSKLWRAVASASI